jgi:hypothetical protein
MFKQLVFILILLFTCSSYAGEEVIKQLSREGTFVLNASFDDDHPFTIEDIVTLKENLEEQYSILIVYDNTLSQWIRTDNQNSVYNTLKLLVILSHQLSKYPAGFIKNTVGLKKVVLTVNSAGYNLPLELPNEKDTFEISAFSHFPHQYRHIHYYIFLLLEIKLHGEKYPKGFDWYKLEATKYRPVKIKKKKSNPEPGYIRERCLLSAREDRAMMFSYMVNPKDHHLLNWWINYLKEGRDIIKKKRNSIIEYMRKINPSFDEEFWKNSIKVKRYMCPCCYEVFEPEDGIMPTVGRNPYISPAKCSKCKKPVEFGEVLSYKPLKKQMPNIEKENNPNNPNNPEPFPDPQGSYIVFYNANNRNNGNDSGTLECNIVLIKKRRLTRRIKGVKVIRERNVDARTVVPIPNTSFDAIKIELTKLYPKGQGGFSEIKVIIDGEDVSKKAKMIVASDFHSRLHTPKSVVDGNLESNKKGGYWLTKKSKYKRKHWIRLEF